VGDVFGQDGQHQLLFSTLLVVQFDGGLDAPATVEKGPSQRSLVQAHSENADNVGRQIQFDISHDQRNFNFVVDRFSRLKKPINVVGSKL
jgi:hypothetical protein